MVWDLETLKKLNEKAEGKAEKRYAVVYTSEWTSDNYKPKFLKGRKLYDGIVDPILTDSLQLATLYSKKDAKFILESMPIPEEWEVWSIKLGYILDELIEED